MNAKKMNGQSKIVLQEDISLNIRNVSCLDV